MNTIATNLAQVKKTIAELEKKYQREPGSVQLLAASKQQSTEKILQAFEAGQTCFGENYLQEALTKIAALENNEIEWHFIGPIQSNKTRKIAEHFAWVHSVDNIKIAERLDAQRPQHLPKLNICIEVNVSAEETKSGVAPQKAFELIQACLELPRLQVRGLMAIPEIATDVAMQRKAFHRMFELLQSLKQQNISLDTLSMGMSGDFEAAIAEGSTLVRIGTAIFGNRS